MYGKWLIILICVFSVSVIAAGTSMGGDLDDGISKYTDDPISKDDELGKPDKNLKFVVLDAIMKAKNMGGTEEGKDKNSNSIVIGPGANLAGAVIINAPQKEKEKEKDRP